MENIFIEASKKKYRFDFRGMIFVEDLWDLGLEDLNTIFKNLSAQLKAQKSEESLLETAKNECVETLENKIAIIKYIADVKKDEIQKRQNAKAAHDRYNKIMEIIEEKSNAELQDKSLDELKAMAMSAKAEM